MIKVISPLLLSVIFAGAAFGQEILVFGGYHTQLNGYTDQRYVGADKGDYLKTFAEYMGAEYLQRNLVTTIPELKDLVLGAGLNLIVRNEFTAKTLYAVPSKGIDAQTILGDENDSTGHFQLAVSGFGGLDREWWSLQGGVTVILNGYNEQVRQKYDASGTIYNDTGRGWVFDNSLILPNFFGRFGPVSIPHIELSLFRGDYDLSYGALMTKIVVPIQGFGSVNVGGSLYQTASIFLEPHFQIGQFNVGLRGGTILNYYDSSFTRVGIFEGAFLAASLGYRW